MEVGEAAPRGSPPTGSSLRRRSVRERAQRDQAPHDTCSGQTLRALTPQCHRLRPAVLRGLRTRRGASCGSLGASRVVREGSGRSAALRRACACVDRGSALRAFASSLRRRFERSRVRRPGTAGPHGITSDLEEEQSPWKERTSVTRNGGQTTTNFVDGARPRSRSARDDSKDQRHALRAPRLSRVSVFAVFGVDQPRPIPR
jgi:hypothetical protein